MNNNNPKKNPKSVMTMATTLMMMMMMMMTTPTTPTTKTTTTTMMMVMIDRCLRCVRVCEIGFFSASVCDNNQSNKQTIKQVRANRAKRRHNDDRAEDREGPSRMAATAAALSR